MKRVILPRSVSCMKSWAGSRKITHRTISQHCAFLSIGNRNFLSKVTILKKSAKVRFQNSEKWRCCYSVLAHASELESQEPGFETKLGRWSDLENCRSANLVNTWSVRGINKKKVNALQQKGLILALIMMLWDLGHSWENLPFLAISTLYGW